MSNIKSDLSRVTVAMLLVTCVSLATSDASAQHETLGGDPARRSVSGNLDVGPSSLSTPLWVFPDSDPSVTGPIRWVADSGPVVTPELVIAVSRQDTSGNPARIWAISREDGTLAWSEDLPDQIFDSWSMPTVDRRRGTVLYATGRSGSQGGVVQARRLTDGALLWETELQKDIVNATIVVTNDLWGRDRAFITDYEGFYAGGDGGILYCINVDPFVDRNDPDGFPPDNPYQPGDIVWAYPLQSGASGATPAYAGRRVFVATAGDFDFAVGGTVLALDPRATSTQDALVWRTDLDGNDAFFGGVSVSGGSVLAATYDFFGGTNSARLVKLDAQNGSVLWQTPTNRTDSIPIRFGSDRILLSTGIPGFGSLPTVRVYQDLGSSAQQLDDTATATWQDDGDGLIELGEFEILGGWTHQPHIVANHPATGGPVAFIGSIDVSTGGQFFNGYTRLSMIDLSKGFGDSGWVISAFDGAGSSPAIAQQSLYTIGSDGVHAFGLPYRLDVDGDGRVDIDDLYAWYQNGPNKDVNRDGTVDQADKQALEGELRRYEIEDMSWGRR